MTQPHRGWPSKIGLLILCFSAIYCFDLLEAWTTSPADRFGWIALLLWISPLGIMKWIDDENDLFRGENHILYVGSLLATLAGQVGRVNSLEHLAVVLAIGGLIRCSFRSIIWTIAGVCWLPAFGWLALNTAPSHVLTLRVALALVGAGFLLAPLAQQDMITLFAIKRSVFAIGIVSAMLLGTLWRFVPLPGAEERLLLMPASGPGVVSWNLPLKPEERNLLGVGLAVRRLYQVGNEELFVSVVDGTLNRHAIHDPVYCFLGAGYNVLADEEIEIEGGAAKLLVIEREGRQSNIVYWFSDGERRYTSILSYWFASTMRRATFGATGPEPVLVIVQHDSEDRPEKYIRACYPLFSV